MWMKCSSSKKDGGVVETVFNGEKLVYRFLLDLLGVTVLKPSSWRIESSEWTVTMVSLESESSERSLGNGEMGPSTWLLVSPFSGGNFIEIMVEINSPLCINKNNQENFS